MPGLNDLPNVNITGRLYGAYQDEPSFALAGVDGLTGLTELLQYILDNLGGAIAVFTTLQENFSGTTYDIPLAVNNGKLPADEDKVEVFTNGILDYPVLDYSIVRNGPGVSDQILFTDERLPQALLVRFIA